MPGTPAARSSSASRTPTSLARRSPTRRTSSTGSTGWACAGTRVRRSPARAPAGRTRRTARWSDCRLYAAAAKQLLDRGRGLSLLLHAGGARRRAQAPGSGQAAAPLQRPLRPADPRRARRARGRGPRAAHCGSASARASSPGTTSSAATIEIDVANIGGDFVIVRNDGTPLYHFAWSSTTRRWR